MANATETVDFATEAPLRGRRVLVADGEARTRWSYVGLLREAGARVAEARDGVEALELARVQPPDLILAEAALPRLDGLGLCSAIRKEPSLRDVTVVLTSDGGPPQALWEPASGSRSLVDAALTALGKKPATEVGGSRRDADLEPRTARTVEAADPGERENLRAQSSLAMHRQPANHLVEARASVFRRWAYDADEGDEAGSSFEPDPAGISRILGTAFVLLLGATVAWLIWRDPSPASERVAQRPGEAVTSSPTPARAPEVDRVDAPAPEPVRGDDPVAAFSGTLRAGVDPALDVGDGQGVLELEGSVAVQVDIDGEERGTLPGAWVLDGGRHVVRYRVEGRATARFYLVVPGTTRVLRVLTQPGGFVDAR